MKVKRKSAILIQSAQRAGATMIGAAIDLDQGSHAQSAYVLR